MPYNPMLPQAGMMAGGMAPQGQLPMQAPQLNPMAGAMQRPMMGQMPMGQMRLMQPPMLHEMPMGQLLRLMMPQGQMQQRPQMTTQQAALRALVQQHSADAMRQQALARAAMGQLPRQGNGNMQRPMMGQGQMPQGQMQRPMMPQGMPQGQPLPLGNASPRPTTPNPLLGINPQLQSQLRSVLGV